MRYICLLLVTFFFSNWPALAQDKTKTPGAKKPAVDEKTVRALIRQLGDDAFDVREAAHKRLAAIGEPALELLKKAAKENSDLEVRERVGQLIQTITNAFFMEVRRIEAPPAQNGNWTTRLAVTPDGRQVVAIGFGSLRCYNLADGKEVVRFEWPEVKTSWALALSADGRRLVVGSVDHVARVFDMKTGKLIQQLKGHTNGIWGAALLPDGKRAVTGGMDQSLRLWDVETGREMRAFENVPDDVECLTVSPDGKLVAVGHTTGFELDVPGMIRLWDVESGREIRTLKGHTKRLCSVCFSRDGKTLLSSSFDATVRLWDVSKGQLLKTFRGHPGRVEAACFTLDEKRVLSVGNQDNPIVVMWDVASGAQLFQRSPSNAGLLDVAVLPDGRHCVTCGKDGVVRLWEWKR